VKRWQPCWCRAASRPIPRNACAHRWRRRWRRSSPSRFTATRSRRKPSRPLRCGAATSSRRRSCDPSHTTAYAADRDRDAGHALGSSSLTGEERRPAERRRGRGGRAAIGADRQAVRPLAPAGRAHGAAARIRLDRGGAARREDALPAAAGRVQLTVDAQTPPLLADAAQLERVFANLIENALRYSDGQPVRVSVRRIGSRVVVRVTIAPPESPTVSRSGFRAFYRGADKSRASTRARASPGDREGLRPKPTAARSRLSRCRARARASWSLPVTGGSRRESETDRARLRRRVPDPPGAAGDPSRRRLRGAAADAASRRWTSRPYTLPTLRSSTSCCRTWTASRSAGACANGARCRSSCSRPSARRTSRCAHSLSAPTTTSPSPSARAS